jgi:hypothetical protein
LWVQNLKSSVLLESVEKMHKVKQHAKRQYEKTIEELFEFENIPTKLLENIVDLLLFDNLMAYRGYTTFIMDFHELDKIFTEVGKFQLKSRCYVNVPQNLTELIMQRVPNEKVELSHLALIPAESCTVDRHLMSDIHTFKTCELSM